MVAAIAEYRPGSTLSVSLQLDIEEQETMARKTAMRIAASFMAWKVQVIV